MIRIFNRNRNAIGQFMVALIFLGTFGFLFTFDGFVSKSEASGCCGGGEAAVTSFAADSSGDFGSEIPMDAEATGGCCGGQDKPIPSSNNNGDDCGCKLESCSCVSSVDCENSSTCANGASCCYDDENSWDCQCHVYCGGSTESCDGDDNPC